MVSLGDDSRRSGGYFFDHEGSGFHGEDEPLLGSENVFVDPQRNFKSLPTLGVLATEILVLFFTEVIIFLLPWYCSKSHCELDAFTWIVLWQSILWVIFLILNAYVSYHHDHIRLRGYLEFYRRFLKFKWIPILVISAGCALMSATVVLIHSMCKPPECMLLNFNLKPEHYMQIIITFENIIILPFLCFQLKISYQFNARRFPPDAQREELSHSGAFCESILTEVGFRGEDNVEEVMERQLDVIRYLKQHNTILSKKIVELSEQNDHLTRRVNEQRAFLMTR